MTKLTVALLNDSFPPTIDGVANAVVNYAGAIERNDLGNVVVARYVLIACNSFSNSVNRSDRYRL